MKNMNTKDQKNMAVENMNNMLPGGGFHGDEQVEFWGDMRNME